VLLWLLDPQDCLLLLLLLKLAEGSLCPIQLRVCQQATQGLLLAEQGRQT
jgi:hypothetical protein